MRINIASFDGRTYMFDTARELEMCGHEAYFILTSLIKTKQFRLKKNCNHVFVLNRKIIPFFVCFCGFVTNIFFEMKLNIISFKE